MRRIYPEDGYSPAERERMRDAFRRRFVDGRHDAYAQFRSEVAGLQAVSADEALQMYADVTRAPLPKAWRTLRARRTVGPVDPADPIALSLGDLAPLVADPQRGCSACAQGRPARRGSVQRRKLPGVLGALYRRVPARVRRARQPPGAAEQGRTRARLSRMPRHARGWEWRRHLPHTRVRAPVRSRRRRAPPHHHTTTTRARVSVPGNHPHTRSPAACVAGSTKSACSRSRRGGPRLARCACARSAESRRAQSTPLSFGAKWRDDATAAIARARNVGSLSLTLERDAAGELSGTPHNSRYFHVSTLMSGVLRLPPSRMRTLNNRAPRCGA